MNARTAPSPGLPPQQQHRYPWYASGWAMVFYIAVARLVLYAFTANRYGYFRDELYYIACSEHLGWGYTDHPPMIALITWLVRHLTGDSLWSLRLLPALAGVGTMALAAGMARELSEGHPAFSPGPPRAQPQVRRPGRFAPALAALAILIAPFYMLLSYLLTMNAFEPLFWSGCAYMVILAIKRQEPRYWLWFGVLAGLGLLNKYSTLVFGFGIVAGLLLTPARRFLAGKWLWIGGAVAFLIALPNVLWNAARHWPFIEFQRNVGRDFASPAEFLVQQVLGMNPFTFPIWLLGLWFFFFSREGKRYRLLGWTYVVVLGMFILLRGKIYYPMAMYPVLLAGGAAAAEMLVARRGRAWLKPVSMAALIAGGALFAPMALPLLSVGATCATRPLLPSRPRARNAATTWRRFRNTSPTSSAGRR